MIHFTEDQLRIALCCEQFHDLTEGGNKFSLRQAAMALGKSPSYFSGANCMYARYQRGGIAALNPRRKKK